MTPTTNRPLDAAKNELAIELLAPDSHTSVLAVGTGQADDRIVVYLQSEDSPKGCGGIPTEQDGIAVETVVIGRFGRLFQAPTRADFGPGLPIRLNTSAPNVNCRAPGTLGAIVCDESKKPQYFILSCNHILAVNGRAPDNSQIVSLPPVGVAPEPIGTFPGEGFYIEIGGRPINSVDCALARLDESKSGNLAGAGKSAAPGDPMLGNRVHKFGAITGLTYGKIVDVKADVCADYSFGNFRFNDQVLIQGESEEFAWDGDSGSIVVDDASGQPVAMVFAEAGEYAVACPLKPVLAQLEGKLGNRIQGHLRLVAFNGPVKAAQ